MAGTAGAVSAPFRAVSVPFSALPFAASAVPALFVIGIWCTTGLARPPEIADMAAADDETLWITLTGNSGLDRGTSFTGTGSRTIGYPEGSVVMPGRSLASAAEDAARSLREPRRATFEIRTDGCRWHTHDRITTEGKPVHWEGAILEWVDERVHELGSFGDTNWNHRSTIE